MQINVDGLAAWELTLIIGGAPYVVAEPTLGAAARMPEPQPDGAGDASITAVIDAMILGPNKPDWNALGVGTVAAAFTAVETYTREYLQRKREDVRAAVRGQPETAR